MFLVWKTPPRNNPLSLHDALPICRRLAELIAGHVDVDGLIATARSGIERGGTPSATDAAGRGPGARHASAVTIAVARDRALDRKSTRSELQSRRDLVCRLLHEKKK